MKKGDRFVVELEYSNSFGYDPKAGEFTLVGADDKSGFWFEQVERAAAAYAAKAAPVTAPDGWEPKRDEVVLVEMEFVRSKKDGEVYVQKGDGNFIAVPRSAIVGPAPKREPGPRFSLGQDALYVPSMEKVIVNHFIGFGKYNVYRMGHESFTADESDLLTLDEARERLAK